MNYHTQNKYHKHAAIAPYHIGYNVEMPLAAYLPHHIGSRVPSVSIGFLRVEVRTRTKKKPRKRDERKCLQHSPRTRQPRRRLVAAVDTAYREYHVVYKLHQIASPNDSYPHECNP